MADGEISVVGINGEDGEGLVQIYSQGKGYEWSSVCVSEWTDESAEVTCRQLGFNGGLSAFYR